MGLADKIKVSKAAWERKAQDSYPTPPDDTQAMLNFMHLPRGMRVLEPCCGEGAMSVVLQRAGLEVTSKDIRFTGFGEGGVDYLTSPVLPDHPFDAVITNPPFNQAEAIIHRAMHDAPLVIMMLPSQYWHSKNRARTLFKVHPPTFILCPTWRPAFLKKERGKSPLMNIIWTVWDQNKNKGPTEFHILPPPISRRDLPRPSQEVLLARNNPVKYEALYRSFERAANGAAP